MQQAVNVLTETIFPGVHVFENGENKEKANNTNELTYDFRISTNLPLQMSLYFNVLYFPFWLILSIVALSIKFSYLHPLYQVILIVVLVVASSVEIIRLYVGYLGNLSEMIPELAGFWILTLLLRLPIQVFLLFNEGTVIVAVERAANIVMLTFVTFQLVCGYFAIRKVSNQLATKFHLETFSLTTTTGDERRAFNL